MSSILAFDGPFGNSREGGDYVSKNRPRSPFPGTQFPHWYKGHGLDSVQNLFRFQIAFLPTSNFWKVLYLVQATAETY